jgi:hypothetical protein
VVFAHLAGVNALPKESTDFILEGFTHCSIIEFWDIHKLLATTLKVCQMRAITGRRDSSTTLAEAQKLCSEVCEVFHSLNLTNKWNIPQNHCADAIITTCYNCGSPDHTSNKCPFLCDKAKITKAKEARDKAIKDGCGGGHGSGRGGGRGGWKGGWGSDHPNTWDKWGANGEPSHPSANKASADGVKKRNGSWVMNCKSCGWSKTHMSETMASGLAINLSSNFLQLISSGANLDLLWRRVLVLPLLGPTAPASGVHMGQLS